ncbi:DUF4150 domain-containing protein, partial [Pseudomonas aeruginosa]|nr:DUF4150 domain-containing protein [Pseudomonas aeruginosa]
MANEVYANNMEISCKAASGKSIAAFPDVCFTPPQAPPTPMGVPIPYPAFLTGRDAPGRRMRENCCAKNDLARQRRAARCRHSVIRSST